MKPTDELDWIDRAGRAADRLLVPRTAAILSACILATHGLLVTLMGAGATSQSLHEALLLLPWDALQTNTAINRPVRVPLDVVLAAALAFAASWATVWSGAGRLGPRVLLAAVAPPWLFHTVWPLWLAASMGAEGPAATSAGFLAGLVLAVVWAERRW